MNRKLFELGSKINLISHEIQRLKCSGYVSIPMLNILEDTLSVVNVLRMEVSNSQKKEVHKQFLIKIPCTEESMGEISGKLQDLEINYFINEVEKKTD